MRSQENKFKYGENLPNVLRNISLKIPKGARVGVVGKTGEGKSTLLDILMGLLRQLQEKRPELRIIIMSATLQVDLFMKYFKNTNIICLYLYIWKIY